MKFTGLFFLLMLFSVAVKANQNQIELFSPDKNVVFTLNAGEKLSYSVQFKNTMVVEESNLGMHLENAPYLGPNMEVTKVSTQEVDETWSPVLKQHRHIQNHYSEAIIDLVELSFPGRNLMLTVRAYNDGVAFRYHIPADLGIQSIKLKKELTTFQFPADITCWAADYESYHSHQEQHFNKYKISELSDNGYYGFPMTLKINENCYAAITEAHLENWSGTYLRTTNDPLTLRVDLAAAKEDQNYKFKMDLPNDSPWRVIMLGDTPGKLIESEIVMNLNPPCEIEDPSWIKPGLCAWDSWWSRDVNMENDEIKKYIDLASENGFPYMLIDWQWYGKFNDDNADVLTPEKQIDMPMLLDYAKKKDVKIWLWLYWIDITPKMEEAFALYQQWGVVGVKIDFMALDDYDMVNWYHETVKLAAKNKLMVNFHGAYKPTGLRRTYPNLMTREGVMGNEHNKWSYGITPEHNLVLPFTRMLAGPMDYTPGGFLNTGMGEFCMQLNTNVMGTRCHELSKFVIYDSPITTVCDHPDHYKNQPGLDFLQEVKAEWDDTRVLEGSIGEYIVMMRRSGDAYFVAGMSDSKGRTLKLDFSFLPEGKFELTLWKDGEAGMKNAQTLEKETVKVSHSNVLEIPCAKGGGFVGIIRK